MSHGFSPIHSINSRLLILGTAPSVRSSLKQQYYGHERNAFWPIMRDVFGLSIDSYEQRWNLLLQVDVALWDVIDQFERKGSSDAAFITAIPNDIKLFIDSQPKLTKVLFNGKKAQSFYTRLIQYYPKHITFTVLPSTSPAYTLRYEDKLELWKKALLN